MTKIQFKAPPVWEQCFHGLYFCECLAHPGETKNVTRFNNFYASVVLKARTVSYTSTLFPTAESQDVPMKRRHRGAVVIVIRLAVTRVRKRQTPNWSVLCHALCLLSHERERGGGFWRGRGQSWDTVCEERAQCGRLRVVR